MPLMVKLLILLPLYLVNPQPLPALTTIKDTLNQKLVLNPTMSQDCVGTTLNLQTTKSHPTKEHLFLFWTMARAQP